MWGNFVTEKKIKTAAVATTTTILKSTRIPAYSIYETPTEISFHLRPAEIECSVFKWFLCHSSCYNNINCWQKVCSRFHKVCGVPI